MKARHIWIVFKKEVKDIIRDKKTVITSIVVPMILIPAMNILMGGGVQSLQKGITENVTIALAKDSNTPEAAKLVKEKIIASNPNIKLIQADDPVASIKNEGVRIVLEFEKDYSSKLAAGKTFEIKLLYDKSKTKSEGAVGIVSEAIRNFNRNVVQERIAALGLDPDILEPAKIVENNVADPKQGGNMVMMMTLPLMIGLLVALGGIPAATDLVAGEKERNTFEPLLTTKPDRASLLIGKYLTVTLFSMVSVAAIVAGMVIGYAINPNSLTMGSGGQIGGFNIPPLAGVLSIIITIALGMTFTGIQIALSTYARSFKEAQTYMSFLIFAAMIPGYATMFMQPNDIQMYMYLLPVLNTIAAFKMLLGGLINYLNLLLALGSSILYVVGTLWLAARLFTKEKMLFRG